MMIVMYVTKKAGIGSVPTARCIKMQNRRRSIGKYYYFNEHGQMLYEVDQWR